MGQNEDFIQEVTFKPDLLANLQIKKLKKNIKYVIHNQHLIMSFIIQITCDIFRGCIQYLNLLKYHKVSTLLVINEMK